MPDDETEDDRMPTDEDSRPAPMREGAVTTTPAGGATEAHAPAEGAQASAQDAAAEPAAPAARRHRTRTVAVAVLALILVAGAVAGGLLWNSGRLAEERRTAAVSTAAGIAVALVSVNSATADQDVQRILDGAVGEFGRIFSENLDSYVDIVRRGGVSTSGEVASVGLQSIDGDSARVLVAIRATVVNEQVPDGEERTYRMAVQLVEQRDGAWLADAVEFVP